MQLSLSCMSDAPTMLNTMTLSDDLEWVDVNSDGIIMAAYPGSRETSEVSAIAQQIRASMAELLQRRRDRRG